MGDYKTEDASETHKKRQSQPLPEGLTKNLPKYESAIRLSLAPTDAVYGTRYKTMLVQAKKELEQLNGDLAKFEKIGKRQLEELNLA